MCTKKDVARERKGQLKKKRFKVRYQEGKSLGEGQDFQDVDDNIAAVSP